MGEETQKLHLKFDEATGLLRDARKHYGSLTGSNYAPRLGTVEDTTKKSEHPAIDDLGNKITLIECEMRFPEPGTIKQVLLAKLEEYIADIKSFLGYNRA